VSPAPCIGHAPPHVLGREHARDLKATDNVIDFKRKKKKYRQMGLEFLYTCEVWSGPGK